MNAFEAVKRTAFKYFYDIWWEFILASFAIWRNLNTFEAVKRTAFEFSEFEILIATCFAIYSFQKNRQEKKGCVILGGTVPSIAVSYTHLTLPTILLV